MSVGPSRSCWYSGVSCRVVFQPGAGGWEASRPIFLAAFDLQTAESELQNWPGELEKQLEFLPSALLSRTALLGFRSVRRCPFRRSGSPGPVRVSWRRPEMTLLGGVSGDASRLCSGAGPRRTGAVAGGKPRQALAPAWWRLSLRHSVTANVSTGLQTRRGDHGRRGSTPLRVSRPSRMRLAVGGGDAS